MIIKVCGLKDPQNLLDITVLKIDMVGYNFFPPSARYVDHTLPAIPENIEKVGVFVNATLDEIRHKTELYKLDFAQLHGDESLSFVKAVTSFIPVIKVFRIHDHFNPAILNDFNFCDYFLFDTSTEHYGGSGKKFNWEIVKNWEIERPFFLSGGIGPDDIDLITRTALCHHNFVGIDINSKFEISPGFKDSDLINDFVTKVRTFWSDTVINLHH